MVVFVDLDEEGVEDRRGVDGVDGALYRQGKYLSRYDDKRNHLRQYPNDGYMSMTTRAWSLPENCARGVRAPSVVKEKLHEDATNNCKSDLMENLNRDSGFAAALGCYPVVKSLTRWLDLNSLHSLSLTCRQFRANLLQFRSQLVRQTLRCHADRRPLLSEIVNRVDTIKSFDKVIEMMEGDAYDLNNENLSLAPKVGKCARDLVGNCRKCGITVCRNCAMKPPANPLLQDRFRRLCTTCQSVPLGWHTSGMTPEESQRRLSHGDMGEDAQSFTSIAFARTPCNCHKSVWLCQPCGQGLRAADVNYKRVWTWRSRYSTHIGGLGTGMGEGDQGQKCGRDKECLEAKDHEVEIDCSADDVDEIQSDPFFPLLERKLSYDHEPGYFRQEIEGIGGVVKKKVKKRVRIGATVPEYDDERESGKYLEREAQGSDRAWCSWCSRVVAGETDPPLDV